MAKITPRTLSGFMELLPAPQQQLERMMDILRKTYALYGFTPLDTPVIEASEVLLAKGGGETEKQIYRFTKGDSDLALRFDLTVPLAKYVALHQNELTFPFRRFQISKVYRGERPRRAATGSSTRRTSTSSATAAWTSPNEAEIPSIIYKTFTALGLKRFQIRVNNRKVLNGLFEILGLKGAGWGRDAHYRQAGEDRTREGQGAAGERVLRPRRHRRSAAGAPLHRRSRWPALNALKGFFAVSLFTTVPVRLYALSVSLQGTFAMEITGAGKSIGELGNEILTDLEGPASWTWPRHPSSAWVPTYHAPLCHDSHGLCGDQGVFQQSQAGRHPAHPDCRWIAVYVQHSQRICGWLCTVDEAGHRPVPHRLPPGPPSWWRAHGVQATGPS